jgi:hypothetical protein
MAKGDIPQHSVVYMCTLCARALTLPVSLPPALLPNSRLLAPLSSIILLPLKLDVLLLL